MRQVVPGSVGRSLYGCLDRRRVFLEAVLRRIRNRRFVALDQERGLVMLIAEMEAAQHDVPYGMLSGWSTYEDGMSSRARSQ